MHWQEGSLPLVPVWAKAGLFWVLNTISSHLVLLLFIFIKQILAITIEYLQCAGLCSKHFTSIILSVLSIGLRAKSLRQGHSACS